jgi:hypothetical protein
MKNLNAVKDISTQAILTFTKSYSCAVAVSQGLINTEPVIIPTSIQKINTHVKKFDLLNDHLCCVPEEWVGSLPKNLITQDYLDRKRIATLRATYIYSLEIHLSSITSRGIIGFDDSVMPHLMREHSLSNPETSEYSYGIVEYANIHNITPDTAYQEIGVMIETCGLIKIRAFTWMQICIDRLNLITNPADLQKEWKDCWEVVKRCAFT